MKTSRMPTARFDQLVSDGWGGVSVQPPPDADDANPSKQIPPNQTPVKT